MKKLLSLTVLIAALAVISLTAGAQPSGENVALTMNQPASIQILVGETFTLDFTLDQPADVTLQAISGTVQPVLTIARNGESVAAVQNDEGEFVITLDATLAAGTYTVDVSGANGTSGLVIVSVQRIILVPPASITPGVFISGELNEAQPFALFTFGNLAEQTYLYVDSQLEDFGVDASITRNGDVPEIVAFSSSDNLGARFRLPAGAAAYQLHIGSDGSRESVPFTVCLAFVSVTADICTGEPSLTTVVPALTLAASSGCTVTPNASGGVNIRQSASTNAVIIGALPSNQSADVQGVSPDGFFFNILFNNLNGWVARSVVTTSGACDDLQTITPPPVQFIPTATPLPTHTPVPQPTVPSGPCLISITAPTYVYQTTIAQVDYLQDQVSAGGQLIPVGRTADNTWWKTNYASAWIQTSTFGNTASVSGNCNNLPTVNP